MNKNINTSKTPQPQQINFLLFIAYDGTDFYGYQRQKNQRTVQQELENALKQLYGFTIDIKAAGRTDAGAHARCQAANFLAPPAVPTARLPWALNALLPGDIRVWEAKEVPLDFHARFSARGKKYTYTIDCSRIYQVMERRYSWHCPEKLAVEEMNRGGETLRGTHDFKLFQASGNHVNDTVRTLWEVKVEDNPVKEIMSITVTGNGFLYKMVRFLAGALVEIGRGRLSTEELARVLHGETNHAPESRRKWPALPARGLCLEEVYYGF